MRIEPGVWTYTKLHAIQFSQVELFYFTPRCSGCHEEAVLGLELSDAIIFRCPRCEAEVDHGAVIAIDRGALYHDFGWVVQDVET